MFDLFARFRRKREPAPQAIRCWMNEGMPPIGLRHETAQKMGWTAFFDHLPSTCPNCGLAAAEHRSDPWVIEGHSQFMVVTRYCPRGHGYTIWLA